MDERRTRQTREFADIVPGQTTEVYLDVVAREAEARRAEQRQPALVMLHGDLPGRVYRLRTGRQLIGRRNDCEIRLREKAVSGHHAEVVRTDAGVSVSDLKSLNGTVVNGLRIRTPVFLSQGNLVKLGNSVFKFVDSLMEVELSESLYVRSTMDPVTELDNRQAFLSRLRFIADGASPSVPLSIVVCDIDNFDAQVESRGHEGAEQLLRHIAQRLHDAFASESNAIARIGDHAFGVALSGVTAASAAPAVGVALEACQVAASTGVVMTDRAEDSAETLLSRAEGLAARARREGGNRLLIG